MCLGILLGISAFGIDKSATLTNVTDEVQYMMIQNNSIIGVSCLLTSQELELYEALGKDYKGVLDGSVKYGKLIKCLIQCESSYNPQAIGDHTSKGYLAFGILQFHQDTFERYSKLYGLNLDYKNPTHQILLCDLMLQDNFNNINHWYNCKNQCLK